jgi:hypothetical protein
VLVEQVPDGDDLAAPFVIADTLAETVTVFPPSSWASAASILYWWMMYPDEPVADDRDV